jgi:hypothetical protein
VGSWEKFESDSREAKFKGREIQLVNSSEVLSLPDQLENSGNAEVSNKNGIDGRTVAADFSHDK